MSKFVRPLINIAAVAIGTYLGGPIGGAIAAALAAAATTVLMKPGRKARTSSGDQVQLGEVPREGMFGEGVTAGSLVDGFNFGGKHGTDWTVMCFALADHECHSLTGFYVKDKFVSFAGNGYVAGYKSQLRVHWCPGAWDDEVPDWVLANCPVVDGVPTWTADDRGRSVAKVWVAYKADKDDAKQPVWAGSPPAFRWVVRGLLCYQARKDSSVGGSGAHRWDGPETREWTDNLIDCRYTWVRGIYAGGQVDDPAMLLLGRGLSAIEAPPENVFASANLCDENVPLAGGGTEKRYRAGGTFGGDDAYIDTEEDLMAACGGWLVERDGSIELVPGSAQPVVWDITDDDLVVGTQVKAVDIPGETDSEWVNTVAAKYIEPLQSWKEHSAPVRRVAGDIIADKAPRVAQPMLSLVTSGTQAQRVAEQTRRRGRLNRKREIVLPPRLIGVQHGDWLRWTSRRHGPKPATEPPTPILFMVQSDAQAKEWRNAITLREISTGVYPWTIADELPDTSVAVDNPEPDFGDAPDSGDWTLMAGEGATLRFAGASDSDAVTRIYFDYASGASAPDADDDTAWVSAGSANGAAVEYVASGLAASSSYWGAVSYQIGAERSARLVLGPVTTGTVAAGTAESAATADELGGTYSAGDITDILDRLSAAGIP